MPDPRCGLTAVGPALPQVGPAAHVKRLEVAPWTLTSPSPATVLVAIASVFSVSPARPRVPLSSSRRRSPVSRAKRQTLNLCAFHTPNQKVPRLRNRIWRIHGGLTKSGSLTRSRARIRFQQGDETGVHLSRNMWPPQRGGGGGGGRNRIEAAGKALQISNVERATRRGRRLPLQRCSPPPSPSSPASPAGASAPPLDPLPYSPLQCCCASLGMPSAKSMLPTTAVASCGSPVAASPRRAAAFRRCPHHHHRRRSPGIAAAAATTLALVLSTSAWFSLVFSSSAPIALFPWRIHRHLSPGSSPLPPDAGGLYPPPPYPRTDSDAAAASAASRAGRARPSEDVPLSLDHIVFGIAGSAQLWPRRREFLRLWWRPGEMRGHVWLEDNVRQQQSPGSHNSTLSSAVSGSSSSLPPIRVSEDISRFRYTNPTGHPSGLRIARIVAETFRLGLYRDARWFVMCDDDTIVSPHNLVAVLAKYDWREMVYVGGSSESHSANTYFSHGMAFGGGGVALSYPLAEALTAMEDECIERYPKLYGSDDRLHACISELGVPLIREHGFHQWDIRGNAHGLLAAHPIAPFVSIHHVEAVDSFYPGLSHLESLKLFTKAMKINPLSFLQRSICYDRRQKLTFSLSVGYVIQVFPHIVLPRELERAEVTYVAWNSLGHRNEFDFDTRDPYRSVCKKPILFFLSDVWRNGSITSGSYLRARVKDEFKRRVLCFPQSPPLHNVKEIQVLGHPLSDKWHMVPRRLCSKINQTSDELLTLVVGECEKRSFGSAAESL
ncbi:hypothetical protein Taro_053243 [Colocasia esculenta]|uniref:Uncharacterized protein n=1 Tax=Colocasia esculenta TaxID=4460 RepID=A0A843XMK6_COLES|nr:hypothetical protein [Colocasia esculenta]